MYTNQDTQAELCTYVTTVRTRSLPEVLATPTHRKLLFEIHYGGFEV